jgi:hypothetical protein
MGIILSVSEILRSGEVTMLYQLQLFHEANYDIMPHLGMLGLKQCYGGRGLSHLEVHLDFLFLAFYKLVRVIYFHLMLSLRKARVLGNYTLGICLDDKSDGNEPYFLNQN